MLHGVEIGTIHWVWGAAGGILRLALLTEGALLLGGVAQRPGVRTLPMLHCVVVELSFRIQGRSISSVAQAVPDRMAAVFTASQHVGYL